MIALMVLAAVFAGAAGAGSSADPPRFSLSATIATTNDSIALRVERAARLPRREIRLYLVPTGMAAAVRSRFDRRLSFIGSVPSTRGASRRFTVPPLEVGRYALAYWCRGCLPRSNGVGIQASPALRLTAPAGTDCPVTVPNGNRPPGPSTGTWTFHGNGVLWALLPRDGVLQTNSLGGHKLPWVSKSWVGAPLTVQYRVWGDSSQPFQTASVVSGTLAGYNLPSWASRMSFQAGCWQITGRQLDVTVSYIAQVVVPTP